MVGINKMWFITSVMVALALVVFIGITIIVRSQDTRTTRSTGSGDCRGQRITGTVTKGGDIYIVDMCLY